MRTALSDSERVQEHLAHQEDNMRHPENAFASSSKMTLETSIEEFEDSNSSDLDNADDYDARFLEELAKAEEGGAQSPIANGSISASRELPVKAMSTQDRKETDFQRYLAGQSVMKSGLTRDQAEVNKIIAEASKNSKFFLREKAKDEQLNKRIDALMKKVCDFPRRRGQN